MLGRENKSEAEVQSEVNKAFNKGATRLFKNVSGKFWTGKLIGFENGIAKLANATRVTTGFVIGAPDRIGFHQITITPEMVGKSVAVFMAIELKKQKGGSVSKEQQNFINFALDKNAIAGVARSVDDINFILANYVAALQSSDVEAGK